jgi:hypothetical protein
MKTLKRHFDDIDLVLIDIKDLLPAIRADLSNARLESAKKYFLLYKDNRLHFNSITNERNLFLRNEMIAPSVYYEDGILRISNGNHRIMTLIELGYTKIYCKI